MKQQPFASVEAAYHRLDRVRSARQSAVWDLDPANLEKPSPAARWFDKSPAPFPAYPAPGAAAVDILSFTVPPGWHGRIAKLAVVHVGGNFIDGSGNVIWRVKVNGAGVQGMENLQSEVGTYAQPADIYLPIFEGDLVEVTVEIPAAQPAINGTTAARLVGWFYPATTRTGKAER